MDTLSPNSIERYINFLHHPHIHHADIESILWFDTFHPVYHQHSLADDPARLETTL